MKLNSTLASIARDKIKQGLDKLPSGSVRKFKLMYSPDDLKRSIDHVVNHMSNDKLNDALTQVENTLEKHDE